MRQSFQIITIFCILMMSWRVSVTAQNYKPEVQDDTYQHNKWGAACGNDILKPFRAYISCFDGPDDDNGDGLSDKWGIPTWVAYEIKRTEQPCIQTYTRPSKWITDKALFEQGIMPDDATYSYSQEFRKLNKNWFDRGHLAMKMHTERLGENAGWNSHTFYNAVPQRSDFNGGIWLDLEYHTDAWAQRYGQVWVIAGPVFIDKNPIAYIGESGEIPAAVPDALFKIVIRSVENQQPDVLAFLYPQIGPSYTWKKPYDHSRFLTSIEEIEELTGITFFTELPVEAQKRLKTLRPTEIWESAPEDFIPACRNR